jgi:hypothetical protein
MAKKRAAKKWDFDPRDAADSIEENCFYAKMKAGSDRTPDDEVVISFSLPVALEIARMLRKVPPGNRRLTARERRIRRALLQKARQHKAELIAAGKSLYDAEWEVAESFKPKPPLHDGIGAHGRRLKTVTWRRLLQNADK